MNRDDRIRVLQMIDACEEALQIAETHSRITLLAVMKDIEIIGEAAAKVTKATQLESPEIPWAEILAMRNRLIHGYFDINSDTVWQTISKDIPPLLTHLHSLLTLHLES